MHSCVGTLQLAGNTPSKVSLPVGRSGPHLTHGSLGPWVSPKWYVDRFSEAERTSAVFCTTHPHYVADGVQISHDWCTSEGVRAGLPDQGNVLTTGECACSEHEVAWAAPPWELGEIIPHLAKVRDGGNNNSFSLATIVTGKRLHVIITIKEACKMFCFMSPPQVSKVWGPKIFLLFCKNDPLR